ncbi:NAD(P)-binding protein [Rhodococcus sp. NJ-530]|uniref:NAD(P)-binding protein n=1 Tax=Rhodococcus sp. NJ-530 TaxID=2490853 RepID=UPI001F14D0AC|nr:NAD(P)-binding protein [Rhodococcus sp. NJ-530]
MVDIDPTSGPSAGDEETRTRRTRVVVIGAGFGGIGTAVRLKQSGIDDFVVLERAAEPGGPGRSIPTPVHSATSRRFCTRSRLRQIRTGRGCIRYSPRSTTISGIASIASDWPVISTATRT